MSKNVYKSFISEFSNTVENDFSIKRYNMYGPISNEYWDQKFRVAIYNLESYDDGYEGCRYVDIDVIKRWWSSKTIRFSAVIANALINYMNTNSLLVQQELRKSYYEKETLLNSISKIAYLNFRITDNEDSPAGYLEINKEFGLFNKFLFKQFELLDPHVVIIGSQAGCYYFNCMIKPETPLKYKNHLYYNDKLFVSMNHTSGNGCRGWYNEISSNIDLISVFLRSRN
ncbi:MAG TPA: hypothetical protein PKN48_02555 [Bacteroidales bacterium]|nr:hypothetical protein [Bacteroidales bacterium]